MPRDEVLVRLSHEQVERILDWTEGDTSAPDCDPDHEGLCSLCEARDKLRSALTEEVEERVEYRAIYDEDGRTWKSGSSVPGRERAEGRRQLEERRRPTATNFRIQSRTITTFKDGSFFTSAWVDLEENDGEGERDD